MEARESLDSLFTSTDVLHPRLTRTVNTCAWRASAILGTDPDRSALHPLRKVQLSSVPLRDYHFRRVKKRDNNPQMSHTAISEVVRHVGTW